MKKKRARCISPPTAGGRKSNSREYSVRGAHFEERKRIPLFLFVGARVQPRYREEKKGGKNGNCRGQTGSDDFLGPQFRLARKITRRQRATPFSRSRLCAGDYCSSYTFPYTQPIMRRLIQAIYPPFFMLSFFIFPSPYTFGSFIPISFFRGI